MTPASRRFRALFALWLLLGLALSTWVTRTPAVRDALGASTAQMGYLFFALSAGSMAGILAGPPLVRRFGTHRVIPPTLIAWIGGSFAIAGGTALHDSVLVGCGLAAFGAGLGCTEIAFNIDGAEVERLLGRPILPFLHGAFSIGTVIGGLAGIWSTAGTFPPALQLSGAAAIAAVVSAAMVADLRRPFGSAHEPSSDSTDRPAWRDGRVLRIALIVLVLTLAEGTANDWLPLVMVDGHGLTETTSAVVYTVFAASMAVGRLTGPFVLTRVPRVAVVAASACLAALGLLGAMFAPTVALAYLAAVLWGLGASLAFPVSISASAEGDPATASGRVSVIATSGYIGFLVGPPMLGLLGEQYGLRQALGLVLILVLVAVVLAPAVRPLVPVPTHTPSEKERA